MLSELVPLLPLVLTCTLPCTFSLQISCIADYDGTATMQYLL